MKSFEKLLMASACAAIFVACGDDSGSNGKSDAGDEILQAETFDDLPNCSKNRDGDIMEVLDERVAYICDDGRWEYDHDILDSVKTEDKLPNCTKKREGDKAYVIKDETVVHCSDGKWQETDLEEENSKTKSSSSKKNSEGKSSGKFSDDDSSDSGNGKSSANSSSSNGGEKSKESSSDSKESGNTEKSSDSRDAVESTGTERDSRDDQVYKTVKIGNQWWFAENLNYDDGYGVCPMKEESNCKKYGRLYTFQRASENASDAVSVCPSGWHVPDSLDWVELIAYVSKNNGGEPVGVSLKAKKGWFVEGDTVLIEAGDPFARDSTRVAAAPGTDRFGFKALPAGSCWERGGCYIGDDTRFAASSFTEFGGGYKLAFDKDDFLFDEDASYGFISVRCLKNPVLKVDPIKSVAVFGSRLWMAEDLTKNGSEVFSTREAYIACPQGWRLPSKDEFDELMTSKNLDKIFKTGESVFFTSDRYSYIIDFRECLPSGTCTGSHGWGKIQSKGLVRCVREQEVDEVEESSVTKASCSASEFNESDSSVVWSVSGCGSDCEYIWDFGKDSAGVKISGKTAKKKFSNVGSATPTVKIRVKNGFVVDGEKYDASRYVTCPSAFASMGSLVFPPNSMERIPLIGGVSYKAVLETTCNEYGRYAYLSCQMQYDGLGDKELLIEGENFEEKYKGEFVINEDVGRKVCDGKVFTLKPSADMECYISYN